jgi:uncharacterized protein YvpB
MDMKETFAFKRCRVLVVSALLAALLVCLDFTTFPTTKADNIQIPTSARIQDMPVFAQQHYLSCEYSAARAAAARWGINLSENDFISNIPTNEDPHLGFRGYIDGDWGGTSSYGIYAEPIALFLATRGLQTKLLWDGVEQVKQEVALGRPVLVWVVGGMGYSTPFEASANGNSFLMMAYEHAMTVYGYDENGVYVADPGFGTYDYYSWATFERSWAYLGNMAMSVYPAGTTPDPAEKPGIAPQFYRYWLRNNGLELTGQPIAPAYSDSTKIYQYFERARLEYDTTLPNYQPIARGLLGQEVTESRRSEPAFHPLSALEILKITPDEVALYYPATGFVMDAGFQEFWQARGGLTIFGYPISRTFYENNLKVQYFERARFELHIETGSPVVMLGLLGNERLNPPFKPVMPTDEPPANQPPTT